MARHERKQVNLLGVDVDFPFTAQRKRKERKKEGEEGERREEKKRGGGETSAPEFVHLKGLVT